MINTNKGGKGMSKSLYSLILNDEVVSRIDDVAELAGTNRSSLINRILAEYVSYTTPEQWIRGIFDHLSTILSHTELVVPAAYSGSNFAVTTSLAYKYRPTVKYCVKLYESHEGRIGELKVLYRINSEELLYRIANFFKLFIAVETELSSLPTEYETCSGKFTRTFCVPSGQTYSAEETGR